MSHNIFYNAEAHIIETKVQGLVTLSEMQEIFAEGIKLAVEKGTAQFLSDFREAQINLSTIEIDNIPNILSLIATPMGHEASEFKRAVITSKDFAKARFSENTMVYHGQHAKFFTDIEEAKKWLMEGK